MFVHFYNKINPLKISLNNSKGRWEVRYLETAGYCHSVIEKQEFENFVDTAST